ncbi:932_t:CDS:2, partial [Gigaspora margarita]
MLQPLVNKLSENEELEIKGISGGNKAQQIHKNMALYLQDLNQNTEIEPIMPIETIGRTWEEMLDNVFSDLMAERGWNKEVQKELYQQLTDSKRGLVWRISKRKVEGLKNSRYVGFDGAQPLRGGICYMSS